MLLVAMIVVVAIGLMRIHTTLFSVTVKAEEMQPEIKSHTFRHAKWKPIMTGREKQCNPA